MSRHLPRSVVYSAVCLVLAAVFLQTSGAARQDIPAAAADNFDIRHDKARAATYLEKTAGDQLSAARVAELANTRVAGLARLTDSYTLLDVLPNTAVGTLEVVGKAPGTGFLTGPSNDRVGALRGFLSGYADAFGVSTAQVDNLALVADYVNPAGNMAWVELEQRINGLPVFQGTIRGGFTAKGELARTAGLLATGVNAISLPSAPSIGAPQAITLAAASVGWNVNEAQVIDKGADAAGHTTFARAGMADDAKAWLLYFPLAPGVVRLAWATEIVGNPLGYLVIVDAIDGTLLLRKNLTEFQTQTATYAIYDDDSPAPMSPSTIVPGSGTQATLIPRTTKTLIGNEAPNVFNSLGWMTDGTNLTDGNNVEAGVDIDGIDGVDAAVPGASRVFDFPYNPGPGNPGPGDVPSTVNFRNGEVTNMFYWTNVYHDRLYRLGFTEPARNFQHDNFGRNGVDGDRIRAEAQDSSNLNNANFFTPADGGRGRAQMFVFPGPDPDRTSGLDQDVLLHELTHGTSNRLHANGSGLNSAMARGMGEGWSDFYARALLSSAGEDVNAVYSVGAWVTHQLSVATYTDNYYYGIRRFPYAVMANTGGPMNRPHNPLTFADIDSTQINLTDGAFARNPLFGASADEVHNLGEVWCMALLEVRARFIARLGYTDGNTRILQFVTDAMKIDPVDPTFLQGRDALLAAAAAGGGTAADIDDIWIGFATRGMGFSATIANTGGANGNSTTRVTEAFDFPGVRGTSAVLQTESIPNGRLDPGETVGVMLCMTNDATTATNTVTGTLLATGGVVSPSPAQSYGNVNPGANACNTFTLTISAACGATITPSIEAAESLGPTRTLTYSMTVGGPVPTFTENFDGVAAPALPAGWSTSTLSGAANLWSTTTTAPSSAPNRAFVTNLTTISDSVLVSPTIALPAGVNRLSFRHFYSLEADPRPSATFFYDGGVLEIAVGGGAFQDITTAGGTFVSGGYNATLTGNPLGARPAWTSSSSGYITTAIDLPVAAGGQNVVLRWRMVSDTSLAFFGWAIDDVSIGQFACASGPAAPVATSDSYSTPFNTPLTVTAPGVLGNDTGTGPLSTVLGANVTHGTLALAADGSFAYTPTTGYSGPDAFTYTANNTGGPSNVATVNLTVNSPVTPAPPVAGDDAFSTSFNTPLNVTPPGVLTNDTGAGSLTASLSTNVTHGALTLNTDGGFTYTPTTDYSGPDAFSYRANNSGGPSNIATVTLTVSPAGVQPPTGLHVVFQSGNAITLAWIAPVSGPSPTNYVLEGGVTPGGVLASLPLGSTAPSVTLSAPTGSFFLRVHTLAGASRSVASNEIQLFVNTPTPPSAPAHLLGLVDGSGVTLAWRNTFAGGAPTATVLEVTGSLSATVPLGLSDTLTFGAMPPGTYTFFLRNTNGGGASAPSNPVTLTFPGACSGVPQAPANFLFFKVGNILTLFWDSPTAGPAPSGYVLNVTGAIAGSVPVGTARMLSAPVGPGTYNISVQAVNACGPGAATPISTVAVP